MDVNNYISEEYIQLLEDELAKERQAREDDKKLYSALEFEYEKTISDLQMELNNTKGKLISQSIMLESYKGKIGIPLITEGVESDLYEGEQKDLILGLLRDAYNNTDRFTRTHKICESLLNANKEVGHRKKIKETIGTIFKSYNGPDAAMVNALYEAGIRVSHDGNHVKVSLAGDDRYVVSVSHTPTDSRCGLNAITDMNKMFF